MCHRNLNGFYIEFLGKSDGVVNGLASFTRQTKYEIAVNYQPELVAVFGELVSALDGGPLFDVLENLRIARLEAYDQQPAPPFFNGLQVSESGGAVESPEQ